MADLVEVAAVAGEQGGEEHPYLPQAPQLVGGEEVRIQWHPHKMQHSNNWHMCNNCNYNSRYRRSNNGGI